ncbi:MAG: excinuclease ABC subunit UvrA [Candidatus Nanoarchaeia archaeon]
MKNIVIKGAREHNLKNIDVTIPRDQLVVITGLSGSGKSTLAFDTIYAEGQRRYVESLSAYARQFLGVMSKPDVDRIEGLSPAISIDQKTTSKNPRSTVGTVTEIYDYLRLLFARIGTPYCPEHNIKIQALSPQKISENVKNEHSGMITVLAPLIRDKKGTHDNVIEALRKEGYMRARIDGKIKRTDEKHKLGRYNKHNIEAVIDRLEVNDEERLTEAIERAVEKSGGLVIISGEKEEIYSSNLACPKCGLAFEELQPRMFSFNSPFGACKECHGIGIKMEFDPELIIPDADKSISEGAVAIYRNAVDGWRGHQLAAVADHFGFSVDTPIKKFTKKQYNALMYGTDEIVDFGWNENEWEGIIPQSERLYHQTESDYRRGELEKFMTVSPCPVCGGKRLNDKALAVKINGKSIIDVTDMPVSKELRFIQELELTQKQREIARMVIREIESRLSFLQQVGLEYLTLSRTASTLSGGEAQRIRLATQIGSNLMGVLYILDEPSIGLHQRDNKRLINTLINLKNQGNTVIVVEHDEEMIRDADHIIDLGPGAGEHGGCITAQGSPKEIQQSDSLTGKYLSGEMQIPVPMQRRDNLGFIRVKKCKEHNLKNIDIDVPIGVLTLITGVSGSGKSTFVYNELYKSIRRKLAKKGVNNLKLDKEIDKVIVIDQSPIGKTPRSNPATYTKVFDEIRRLFAETHEAKSRGYKAGRFSFNVRGGRCEACQGEGLIKIEMNFLPDVFVECEECRGNRYNRETLEVKYKGKNIAEVLNMSVEQALDFFKNVPSIKRKLKTLRDVGLSYIKLGQNSVTLSGGEAQRIKLTRELSKRGTGQTLYLLDEPTTGLHFHDVYKLINVLNTLVDKGNSVVVIEHNLDVIKSADHIIDLGPEGGDAGGRLIAEGTPEEVAKIPESYTGQYLQPMLPLPKRNGKKKIAESV